MERWPMATATTQEKPTASLHETGKQHKAQHLREGGRVSMSRRTNRIKWIIAAAAALLGAVPASAQSAVTGTTNFGSPTWEVPIPLMWGEKDEGFYFSAEAAVMRINNALQSQVVARRGFIDYDGSIKGNPDGGDITILDGNGNFVTTLLRERGPAGAVYGSQAVALSTDQVSNDVWQPGSRFTIGYRLRNGVTIEGSYMGITKSRVGAVASVTPPNHNTGNDNNDSFLYGDYYNFNPYFAGPTREMFSNVFLQPLPPAAGATYQPTTLHPDLTAFGAFAVGAYGITNGAEVFRIAQTMGIHTSELNLRVPVAQFEGTRTYWTGGIRYISFTEQFRMIVQDFGFPDGLGSPIGGGIIDTEDRPQWSLRYTTKQKDIFYGLQTGVGGEAYLFNGLAFSIDGKIGIMAEQSKSSVVLQRMDLENNIGIQRTNNLFTVAGLFQGGAYLWWYAHEGITFRVGYEYLGILNARRMVNPIDYNWGQLNPDAHNSYLSLDGFVMGFSFTF